MPIQLPYGDHHLSIILPSNVQTVDLLLPNSVEETHDSDPVTLVKAALSSPLGAIDPLRGLGKTSTVAITVNDKTRPVPNTLLLKPLIDKILDHGVLAENITIFIASGTHLPMDTREFCLILGEEIINRYRIVSHNCDDEANLCEIGRTFLDTPVFVNRDFYKHEVKLVVGDIELHHFAGYSGGVKSAAIGLCGRETINTNHRLLLHPGSAIGNYENNQLRQDIEEIGRMIGIDLALNAVLNENKEILQVFFGNPISVMQAGIKLVNKISQVVIGDLYDLVIASAGGYPKDINLYQSQKAMTHAAQFCRKGGSILLFAECREGAGSQGYLDFMVGVEDPRQVIEKFTVTGFSVGPHKAYQVARILEKCRVFLKSSMDEELVNQLLLIPIPDPQNLIKFISAQVPIPRRIAVLPYATACIPYLTGGDHDN